MNNIVVPNIIYLNLCLCHPVGMFVASKQLASFEVIQVKNKIYILSCWFCQSTEQVQGSVLFVKNKT